MSVIAPSEYALEARDLVVARGGQTIIDIPLFQVKPKEMLTVIGPNGTGKTTLVLSLALLLKPAGGKTCRHRETTLKRKPYSTRFPSIFSLKRKALCVAAVARVYDPRRRRS